MGIFATATKNNDFFALDIGSSSIKVLQLAKKNKEKTSKTNKSQSNKSNKMDEAIADKSNKKSLFSKIGIKSKNKNKEKNIDEITAVTGQPADIKSDLLENPAEITEWSIVAIGHSPINRSIVADRAVVDTIALSSAIEAAIKNAGIKTKNVYSAMPSSQASTSIVTVPAGLSIIEQEDYMQMEAGNYIPFPVEEVKMDFEVLGRSKEDPDMLDVLLVACKTEEVEARLEALNAADLTVEVLDIDEFAIERAMRYIISKEPIVGALDPLEVVIDLGHEFTIIHVLRGGRSVYTREQNFGMKQLTDEVTRRFGLSLNDALIAMAEGKLPAEYNDEILPQFRSETANQVNRLLQFFFAATSYNRVHRIWISGGGGSLPDITEEVSNLIGVETRAVNPMLFVNRNKNIDEHYVESMGASFLTAFGLAIRED